MNTKQKGEIAQLKVELRAIEKDYIVSRPTREDCRYDLIVDTGLKLLRAQIKYPGQEISGAVRVYLRKAHKNRSLIYSAEEIDIVLVYIPQLDIIIKLDPEHFDGKHGFYIRFKPTKSGMTKNINWFEDYIW